MGRIAWILPSDHVLPPRMGDQALEFHVFVDRCRAHVDVSPCMTRRVLDWDLQRARRRFGQIRGRIEQVGNLLPPLARDSFSVVVCSASFRHSQELARLLDRPVLWLQIGGVGATEQVAAWRSWFDAKSSLAVGAVWLTGAGQSALADFVEIRTTFTSPAITHLEALRATGGMLLRRLRSRPEECETGQPSFDSPKDSPEGPSERDVARSITRRSLGARLREPMVQRDQWSIAVTMEEKPDLFALPSIIEKRRFNWWTSGKQRFIADPFLAQLGQEMVVFFEELPFDTNCGRIKAVAIDHLGNPAGDEVIVLERGYHLSFPCVVEDPAEPESLFMVPQQAESGRTILYRSDRAEDLQKLHFVEDAILLDSFPGIDPVLHFHEDQWYLFTSDGRWGNKDNNLQLFVSERIRGPFRPHPSSPIRLGLRGSRMAGRLIATRNGVYRPGQDCLTRYGAGVILFKVNNLSSTSYLESEALSIAPNRRHVRGLGLHTLSMMGSVIVIDGLGRVRTR